jgi:hypothetical protein
LPTEPHQPTAQCWECEVTTDAPITVSLQTRSGAIGKLRLCPTCYQACYLPLTSDASMTLFIDAEDAGRPLAR